MNAWEIIWYLVESTLERGGLQVSPSLGIYRAKQTPFEVVAVGNGLLFTFDLFLLHVNLQTLTTKDGCLLSSLVWNLDQNKVTRLCLSNLNLKFESFWLFAQLGGLKTLTMERGLTSAMYVWNTWSITKSHDFVSSLFNHKATLTH